MGKALQCFERIYEPGQPISPLRVQRCPWIHGKRPYVQDKPRDAEPVTIKTTKEGWPIQPFLSVKTDSLFTPNQSSKAHLLIEHWQKNGEEKEILHETYIPLLEGILWPGGKDYDHFCHEILGKAAWDTTAPRERMLVYTMLNETLLETVSPHCLDSLRKIKGIMKKEGIPFILTHLPTEPQAREISIQRRNQFFDRAGRMIYLLRQENKKNPHEWSDYSDRRKVSTAALQEFQEAIDAGEDDATICEIIWKDKPPASNARQCFILAKLLQGNQTQFQETESMLDVRRDVYNRISELGPAEAAHAEKANKILTEAITALEAHPKGKLSRLKTLAVTQNWYYQADQAARSKNSAEALQAFERADSLLLFLLEWEGKALAKEGIKALQKIENKKPEEHRHEIRIPDTTHIRDFFNTTTKGPIPANLSPAKLIDKIRRWDHSESQKHRNSLDEPAKLISPAILKNFPAKIDTPEIQGVLLTNNHEFEKESRRQNHCVRTYFDRAAAGTIAVFSLKVEGERWTAEVEPSMAVKQVRGNWNKSPSKEILSKIKKTMRSLAVRKVSPFPGKALSEDKAEIRRLSKALKRYEYSFPTDEAALMEKLSESQKEPILDVLKNPRQFLVEAAQGIGCLDLEETPAKFYTVDFNTPTRQNEWKEATWIDSYFEKPKDCLHLTYKLGKNQGLDYIPFHQNKDHIFFLEEDILEPGNQTLELNVNKTEKIFLLSRNHPTDIDAETNRPKIERQSFPYQGDPALEILKVNIPWLTPAQSQKTTQAWALELGTSHLENLRSKTVRKRNYDHTYHFCDPETIAKTLHNKEIKSLLQKGVEIPGIKKVLELPQKARINDREIEKEIFHQAQAQNKRVLRVTIPRTPAESKTWGMLAILAEALQDQDCRAASYLSTHKMWKKSALDRVDIDMAVACPEGWTRPESTKGEDIPHKWIPATFWKKAIAPEPEKVKESAQPDPKKDIDFKPKLTLEPSF